MAIYCIKAFLVRTFSFLKAPFNRLGCGICPQLALALYPQLPPTSRTSDCSSWTLSTCRVCMHTRNAPPPKAADARSFQALTQYRNRINSTLVLHVEEFGEGVLVREDFMLDQPEAAQQASDLATGVLVRLCRNMLGPGWHPELACFTHAAPPAAEMAIYRRLIGSRLAFDSEYNGLVIDRRDLDGPNLRADAALAEHARDLIDSVTSPDRYSVVQQVEQSLFLSIPAGLANIQTCSGMLGTTVRTLQRNLDAEGASFSTLLNKTRMQLSAKYLSNRRTRITDVAEMLGYSATGAFTRWHVSAFGTTPRAQRAALNEQASRSVKAWREHATSSPPPIAQLAQSGRHDASRQQCGHSSGLGSSPRAATRSCPILAGATTSGAASCLAAFGRTSMGRVRYAQHATAALRLR